jgi:putative pyruvate formate lyase activating enzyme
MWKQSRRQFIKSCVYWAISGSGPALFTQLSGCKRKEKKVDSNGYKKMAKIAPDFKPAYLKLHRSGELKKRGEKLWKMMEDCNLCPRECGVNRLEGNEGFCKASSQLEVSSYHPHFGEERPLVGKGGSGAIFFTNCGLRCVFCINWEISHEGRGEN